MTSFTSNADSLFLAVGTSFGAFSALDWAFIKEEFILAFEALSSVGCCVVVAFYTVG